MEDFQTIIEFFTKIKCSQCQHSFDKDSVKILRQEENCTVIRVTCSNCSKNIGLAIMGMDKEKSRKTSELSIEEKKLSIELNEELPPIDYDDVISAHNFFYNLGSDWSKHLPNT